MKYVAFLRGINVGGNSIIRMDELKVAVNNIGFTNVKTYTQSGNVIFESDIEDVIKIREELEKSLSDTFAMDLRIVVRTYEELKKVLKDAPIEWKRANDLRCYIAFVKEPVTPKDVLKEIHLKEGVDFVKKGEYVVYMSTKLEGLTHSGFTELVGTSVYKDITIRSFNAIRKLLKRME
ncbi:MAG: hypothetical protein UT63_C0068G0014 [Candidatus Gottesmanbacteria bacterium GW2011_GWC2_39_8]|uniref:DUF1697 domain-containing protein n=1 Tax=Candidatus Gottesmanbacteria bacterium GW2011_GWC2_39_8 TaxID=1618450 RepID=A0A0G0PTJ9_9BACT|nr:MAG: hypothetical protein UT63_C0068G0014 [Candidatus Gottesmanbacteria bacterium GW2011_GWC2_39_8]